MLNQPLTVKQRHVRTFDWTSALWSFWSSSAADLVSSLRAAMCRAGRRTFPLVSFSSKTDTTWLWPCWRAMARGVKPSWEWREEEWIFQFSHISTKVVCPKGMHVSIHTHLLDCMKCHKSLCRHHNSQTLCPCDFEVISTAHEDITQTVTCVWLVEDRVLYSWWC